MKKMDLPKLIISIIIPLWAGVIGSLSNFEAIPTWYSHLNKPFFNPPAWLFAPVWTVLYILMGISFYLIWKKGCEKQEVGRAMGLFAIQIVLNVLWSFLFFGLHSPLLGFINIVLLLAAIVYTSIKFSQISRTAGYLFIPYILWTSFATILNFSILIMNP